MIRDATYTDLSRAEEAGGPAAELVAVELVMDEETFRGFYERTARGLWAYLARVTGNRSLADDLLQETYYRFLRAAAVHENEAHRRNSIYRIATNLARDARRRQVTRAPSILASGDIEGLAAKDSVSQADRQTDLARAMSNLKPRERAMLWLAYAEGASHREIASVLGLNPASLRPLLFRLRRKLAGMLRGQPVGGPS